MLTTFNIWQNPKTIAQKYLRKRNIIPTYNIWRTRNTRKFFRGHVLVRQFYGNFKKSILDSRSKCRNLRDKKSDRVKQRRNNTIQSLGNNDNIHSSERVRERFILRDSESLFFREIVYLQCYALRAAKIFGR